MGISSGRSFERVYGDYLAWFHETAVPSAKPKEPESVLQYQLGNDDVFEEESIILNRLFYFVPLFPSESKSGQLELFVISELNLLQQTDRIEDDFDKVTSVEYTGRAYVHK